MVKHNICIVGRLGIGIITVQIEIRLNQTAVHQAHIQLAACVGPQAEGIQQFISGGTADNRATEFSIAAHPVGAAIVGEQHQRVKLVLVQLQLIAVNEEVDILLHIVQISPEEFFRLLFSNSVGIFIPAAAASIANCILAIVIDRELQEPFHLLQNLDTRIAGGHIRSGKSGNCHSGNHAKKHQCCQQDTHQASVHRYTFSFY